MTVQLNTTNYIVSTSASKFDAALSLIDSHIKKMTESLQTKYLNWDAPSYSYDMAFNSIINEGTLSEAQLFTLVNCIFSSKHLNSNPIFSSAARTAINKNKFSDTQLFELMKVQLSNDSPNTFSIRCIIKATSDMATARKANNFLLNLKPGVTAQYEPKNLKPDEYAIYFSEVEKKSKGSSLNYDKVNITLLDEETKNSILDTLSTNKMAKVDCLYNLPIKFTEEALKHHAKNNNSVENLLKNVHLENNDETLYFVANNTMVKERLTHLVYSNNTAKNAIEQLLKATKESQWNAVKNSLICSKDSESNTFLLDHAIECNYINIWAKNNDIDKKSLKKIHERASRSEFKNFLEVVFERAFEYKMVENLDQQPAQTPYFDKIGAIKLCNSLISELLTSRKVSVIEALTLWPPVLVEHEKLALDVFNENTSGLDEQSIRKLARCFVSTLPMLNNSVEMEHFINPNEDAKKSLLTLALSKLGKNNIKLDLEKITCEIYASQKKALTITHFHDLKKLKASFVKDALASTGLSLMCFLANGKLQMSPKDTQDVITTVASIVTRIDAKDRLIGGTQFINYLSQAITNEFIDKDLAEKLNENLIKAVTKIPLSKINNNTDILENLSSDKNQYPDIIANEITAAILKQKVKSLSENESNALMHKLHRNQL